MTNNDVVMVAVLRESQINMGGKTRLFRNGVDVTGLTRVLKIVHYVEDSGAFYLIRYDANESEVGDTYHSSIEEAKDQAKYEYGVEADQWRETCGA
jgi:hypothetical protein